MARHAHAVTVPPYSEVMRVDGILEETWRQVPAFMRVRPLEECVTDPPMQVIQRFGLATLYLKGRCVLHRRYLSEGTPRREHAYSRRSCLEAALLLLEHQQTLHDACKPGALLYTKNWFISSLTINDFLLADMVVALILQSEHYRPDAAGRCEWMSTGAEGAPPPATPLPTKDELLRILHGSYRIWTTMVETIPDCRKAADVVRTLLGRVYAQLGTPVDGKLTDVSAGADVGVDFAQQQPQPQPYQQGQNLKADGHDGAELMAGLTLHGSGNTNGGGGGLVSVLAPAPAPMTVTSSVSPEILNYHISPDYEMVDPDPSWIMYGSGEYDWVSPFPSYFSFFSFWLLSSLPLPGWIWPEKLPPLSVVNFGEISNEVPVALPAHRANSTP